jgi:hypothetical protein
MVIYNESDGVTGAERCLAVKRATDELLIGELGRAMRDQIPTMPSLANPPCTPRDVFHLLVLEVFLRFQDFVKENRDEDEHG